MRPLTLRLSAFGSYAEEEAVDFEALAPLGLFVVTGPTGAGKTTLFDAMAYALYGQLPGDRPDGEVRSHHADAGRPTWVELELELDGVRWKVRRSPSQPRPAKRGAGTVNAAATAELHEWVDGHWVGRESKVGTVTARCAELIGLDLDQFERVVLLPQGKFQQFLLADTKQRRDLLAQLFGTRLYREAVERLKLRARELDEQCQRIEVDIDHHRRNAVGALAELAVGLGAEPPADDASLDEVATVLASLREPLATANDQAAALQRAAAEARAAATAAAEQAASWDERDRLRQQLQSLQADQAARDLDRVAAREAARAAPVVAAHQRLHEHEVALAQAEARLAAASAALIDHAVQLGLAALDPADAVATGRLLAQARATTEDRASRLAALADARHELADATQAVAEADEQLAQLAADALGVEAEQAELAAEAGAVALLAEQVTEAERAVDAARRRLQRREDLARDEPLLREAVEREHAAAAARDAVLARFVAGAAPRLAATLSPGDPCPVCGSTVHPRPALGEAEPVDKHEVDDAQTAASDATQAASRLREAVAAAVDELGDDATTPVAHLRARLAAAEEALDAAAAAAARRAAITDELAALAERRTALVAARASAETVARTAHERAQRAQARVDELVAAVGDDTDAAVEATRALLDEADAALSEAGSARDAVAAERGARDAAERHLADALAECGFADVEAALAVALPPDDLAELTRAVDEHDRALAEVTAGLAALDRTPLPTERPDVDGLATAAAEVEALAGGEAARVGRLADRADTADRSLDAARRAAIDAEPVRRRREIAQQVARTCDGQGPGRIGLETWVLGGELDRVAAAATVHLAAMTSGRYRLERTDEAGHRGRQAGLDLRVFDSHTGRSRSTATLSGGEQFQASLALALGLADVVSQGGRGTGRVYECLFVDEGFGSLDPDALDQAIDTLDQLRAGGRLIGVITHVEAMKQTLPVGIEVRRRADDRGSTLVQR
jgi:exonuclease SbcC